MVAFTGLLGMSVGVRWLRFRGNGSKNEGDDMTKSDDFQRMNLSSVGRILGTQI